MKAVKSKKEQSQPAELFSNQLVRHGALDPGQCLELHFQTGCPATITLLGAERCPSIGAVLDQEYLLELLDATQPIPLARKESLRGVVVTTLTQTVDRAGPEQRWIARLHNTGGHPQELSLLVAIA